VAARAWERERVTELLGRRVPWPHIARQVGKPERQLRATYEHLTRPPAPLPAPASRERLRPTPRGVFRKAVLRLVAAAPGLSATALGDRMDTTAARVAFHLARLKHLGHARNTSTRAQASGQWVVTDEGRAWLARHEDDDE
jgi:hypothetical protein